MGWTPLRPAFSSEVGGFIRDLSQFGYKIGFSLDVRSGFTLGMRPGFKVAHH